MKITHVQIERLVRKVIQELNVQKVMVERASAESILKCGVKAIEKDLEKERQLERDVTQMVDDLEKKSGGGFDRRKMFQMVKKKLAEERKVIL